MVRFERFENEFLVIEWMAATSIQRIMPFYIEGFVFQNHSGLINANANRSELGLAVFEDTF